MERREFLKIAGVTGAGATAFGCTPKATEKLIPYLVPPDELVPGVATWYATVADGPEPLGVHVKTREGRPILIQGNPAHPLSGGAMSALAQAELQGLYDPDRVRGPAIRASAERFRAVSWNEAEGMLVARLREAGGGGIYFLGGHVTGSLDDLVDRWLAAFGSPNRVAYEAFGYEPVLAANRIVFGQEAIPTYDVARARYVLSFGADFLETWVAPTYFSRGFGEMHAFGAAGMGKFVHVEPRLSLTASQADEWIAPRPGTEMLVALAIANAMGADAGGAGVAMGDFAPEAVAEQTDVPAETIRRIAREFADARPSLALGSGIATTHRNATATWVAANLLNQAAGNVGETVRFGPNFQIASAGSYRAMQELVRRMQDGRVRVLLVHGANPAFTLPPALGFREALQRVPFKVCLDPHYTETAALCDALFPSSHSLESWGDAEPVDGVRALRQPVLPPLHDTRMLGDILLRTARAAGVAGDLPEDFASYVRQLWSGVAAPAGGGAASASDTGWTQALSRGGAFGAATVPAPSRNGGAPAQPGAGERSTTPADTSAATGAVQAAPDTVATTARATAVGAFARLSSVAGRPAPQAGRFDVAGTPQAPADTSATQAPADTAAAAAQAPRDPSRAGAQERPQFAPAAFDGDEDGLHLMVVPTVMFHDGRGANKPWMQELPDPVTKAVWGSWVEIHPETARARGIKHGDPVDVRSPHGRVTVPAFLYPGIRPDTVAIPIGQGHTEYGRYAKNRGANPIALLPAEVEPVSGGPVWFGTRVTLAPGSVPDGVDVRLIELQGSAHQHSRGIAMALSLPEARESASSPDTSPAVELMPEIVADAHEDSPYRWGMTIDLAKCIGCSACVTACQMENNIAFVGPDDAGMGRELLWLRIERYWDEPAAEAPMRVRHLPMLCQHCGHAPCEPVCPVYAAYHNPEGLNAQIYNRCVGTRYCANNCPYKVRKFNFFQPSDVPEPLNLQYNPDVTVRSKGVMEKCTFCVQRIRDAKHHARAEGRQVLEDGDVVTACQAACPTGAIMFGNLRDTSSRVYREATAGRGYHVLPTLNTHPAVTYLADVVHTDRPLRDSAGGAHGAGHATPAATGAVHGAGREQNDAAEGRH